jgi:hypothetical protein
MIRSGFNIKRRCRANLALTPAPCALLSGAVLSVKQFIKTIGCNHTHIESKMSGRRTRAVKKHVSTS